MNALLAAEVEFHPYTLIVFVVHAERMASAHMHLTTGSTDTAVTHNDRNLMKCLWKASPEIPVRLRVMHICFSVTLYNVIKIRETLSITEAEYWCVVTYDIPVAFLSVKLNRCTTNITLSISGPTLTCNSREANKYIGLLAEF